LRQSHLGQTLLFPIDGPAACGFALECIKVNVEVMAQVFTVSLLEAGRS
jgi:hypothetical protein